MRSLRIDAGVVGDVLIGLEHDTVGPTAHWTLGRHGSADLDVDFSRVAADGDAVSPAWRTTAWLSHPDGGAPEPVIVELCAVSSDTCELTVWPKGSPSPWWSERPQVLLDLAGAAADELGEELLWHARHVRVATSRAHPVEANHQ